MNLKEIRQQFAKLSGRYDLVDPDTFADTGVDYYIKAGQQFLDRISTLKDSTRRIYGNLSINDYKFVVPRARIITNVVLSNAETRLDLTKLEFADFIKIFTSPISSITPSFPKYFTLSSFSGNDVSKKSTLFLDYASEIIDFYDVVLFPPVSEAFNIEVWGKFFASELKDAYSYWVFHDQSSGEVPSLLLATGDIPNLKPLSIRITFEKDSSEKVLLYAIDSDDTTIALDSNYTSGKAIVLDPPLMSADFKGFSLSWNPTSVTGDIRILNIEFSYTANVWTSLFEESYWESDTEVNETTYETSNKDQNFWTIKYPNLLVNAALHQLEISYRNTEGVKDWLSAITTELAEIDKDGVEEEISWMTQIAG